MKPITITIDSANGKETYEVTLYSRGDRFEYAKDRKPRWVTRVAFDPKAPGGISNLEPTLAMVNGPDWFAPIVDGTIDTRFDHRILLPGLAATDSREGAAAAYAWMIHRARKELDRRRLEIDRLDLALSQLAEGIPAEQGEKGEKMETKQFVCAECGRVLPETELTHVCPICGKYFCGDCGSGRAYKWHVEECEAANE